MHRRKQSLMEYYFRQMTNPPAWSNMQKIRYSVGFSDFPLCETRIMCCRSIWTHIAQTLHGHPHRSLVAQQQFSSSLEAKKLHNYSSSQKRILCVLLIASFSKLYPTSIRCGSEWGSGETPALAFFTHPEKPSNVKVCECSKGENNTNIDSRMVYYELWSIVALLA